MLLLGGLWYLGRSSSSSRSSTGSEQHCYFLIDRSGSMEKLADGVVDGFNRFVSKQAEMGGGMRLTLAQFDSGDPFELVVKDQDVTKVRALKRRDFRPRGTTPLYDAIAQLVAYADSSVRPSEAVVIIVFSDGMENASRKHSKDSVFRLVEERKVPPSPHHHTHHYMRTSQTRLSPQPPHMMPKHAQALPPHPPLFLHTQGTRLDICFHGRQSGLVCGRRGQHQRGHHELCRHDGRHTRRVCRRRELEP